MDPPEVVVPHPETSNVAPVGIASSESTNSAGAALSKKIHFMANKSYKVCTYKKPYMLEVGSFAKISKQASLVRS